MSSSSSSSIPKIVNIEHVKTEDLSDTMLLHFTEEQWQSLIKDVKHVEKADEAEFKLQVVTLGRSTKAGYIAVMDCPSDCHETPQRLPDGSVVVLCKCPNPGPCRVAIRLWSGASGTVHVKTAQLVCVDDKGQLCKDFHPLWWPIKPFGGYLICIHN